MTSFKKKIVNGTLWAVGGNLIVLFIGLIANIYLAHLLSPKEFGQVGIIMFFIMLFNVFSESGLTGALIRKKSALKIDYSTVFIFNLVISLSCFLVLVLISGYVSDYYKDEMLKNLLLVSGFVIIINAFRITQNAKLISDLKFKQRSIYRFFSVLISSVVGIIAAYKNAGVWSLVILQLLNSLIFTVLLWVFEGFYFQLRFSMKSFKELYAFGVNTTLASLLNTAFDNIYQLILGRYFSINQVGFYYQAKKLQDIPGGMLNMVVQNVIFSALSKLQDNIEEFKKAFNKVTLFFNVLLALMSLLIFIYAENIILILYGEKWLGSVFYMQLLVIASFFHLNEYLNRVIFKVFNKTEQILYLEFVKKTIQSISIFLGVYFLDLKILIIGFVITNAINYFINYHYSRKIIKDRNLVELYMIVKIFLVAVIVAGLFYLALDFGKLAGFKTFLIAPLLLLSYFLILKLFKIFNLTNELINLKNIWKYDK